jgi:hypothetical protein
MRIASSVALVALIVALAAALVSAEEGRPDDSQDADVCSQALSPIPHSSSSVPIQGNVQLDSRPS